MRLLIVIPTYNEAENISGLIHRIHRIMGKTLCPHILVVDDNSPDGTGSVVAGLARARNPERISTICRPAKLGLASAYVAGFQWGLARGFDAIAELAEPGSDGAALAAHLSAARRRVRATYDEVVAAGSIRALID